jgi:hypothetical protein
MKRIRISTPNILFRLMMPLSFLIIAGGCVQGGHGTAERGNAKGGDATQNILTGGLLNLTPNISPNIQFEMKDSMKDLVDLPLGDSAIDAAIKAAGDYMTGGSTTIAAAAAKGVEAATKKKSDLTEQQQERIKNVLVKGLEKNQKKKGV